MPRARVLVVDDEAGMRDFLQIMLEEEGHEVAVAADVPEAMDLLGGASWDVVITDLKMPGGSGLEVLEAVRERDPGCAVFVMTAYGDTESAVAAMKLGACDYLTKPFQVEALRRAVGHGLAQRRLAIENRRLREQA
ncbi:MAG: sigma-54-dependent Fis family transcriptional regulator, partial [Nitrospirae bacterium]